MKVCKLLINKIKNWDCHYSDGKKSHCWKYNIADIFDPLDD